MPRSQETKPVEEADKEAAALVAAEEAAAVEASAAKEEPAPVELSGKYVEHIPQEGFGGRLILKSDWSSIGIEGEDVEWNVHNSFKLPIERFNDAQLRYLTEVDDGFEVVGG